MKSYEEIRKQIKGLSNHELKLLCISIYMLDNKNDIGFINDLAYAIACLSKDEMVEQLKYIYNLSGVHSSGEIKLEENEDDPLLKYYMGINYPIEMTVIPESDGGGILASIPMLKWCTSDGATYNEAAENLKDAKREWLKYTIAHGFHIPEPTKEKSAEKSVEKSVEKSAVKSIDTHEVIDTHEAVDAHGTCYDCGRRYGDKYGFPDLIIEDWAWELINPTNPKIIGAGLLCPSCICHRLALQGIKCKGAFTSGGLSLVYKSEVNK